MGWVRSFHPVRPLEGCSSWCSVFDCSQVVLLMKEPNKRWFPLPGSIRLWRFQESCNWITCVITLSVKLLVMDCWLPGMLCGLLETFCCLEVTWSAAFPPSSGGVFHPHLPPFRPGLCWANILEQPPSWAAERVWSFHHAAVAIRRLDTDLDRANCPLCSLASTGHMVLPTQEAINEKFLCHDVCPNQYSTRSKSLFHRRHGKHIEIQKVICSSLRI